MRFLKVLATIVVLFAVVLFGGGLMLSPKFHVERSTVVNAPADKVYALVADPHRWKDWTVWNRRKPCFFQRFAFGRFLHNFTWLNSAARRSPAFVVPSLQ